MDKSRLKELRVKAQSIKPTIHIGKDGVSESVKMELRKQLKKHKLVKVKLLPASQQGVDKKEMAGALAKETDSALVDVRGNTAVFFKD